MLRCPVCKADNSAGRACRRCKADLSLLFALEEERSWQIAEAGRCLTARQWRRASLSPPTARARASGSAPVLPPTAGTTASRAL